MGAATPRAGGSGAPKDAPSPGRSTTVVEVNSSGRRRQRAAPDEMWSPLQSWLAGGPGRGVTVGALALILAQLLVRGYVTFTGWFVVDDYAFTARALRHPLLSTEYLLEPWNGHVMPGAFAWVHVLANLSPLNYVPVGLSDLALQALTGWVVFLVLRALFGARPGVLIPLGFYLFSVITLPASLWWAAALNQLPGQFFAAVAIWFHVAYLRRGRLRFALAGVAALALGLLFSEKMLLVAPLVFALTFLWFTAGSPVTRLRRALVSHRWVWVGYTAVVVPYVGAYLAFVPAQVGARGSVDTVLHAITIDFARAIVPAAFGGPYAWVQLGIPAIANPSTFVVVLSLMVTALVVAWSVVRRYRAIFAWLVIGVYLVANATLIGLTRGADFGPNVVLEYRYSTDVALVIALFSPFAFVSITGKGWQWPPQRLAARRAATGALGSAPPNEQMTTIVVVSLLVVGSTVSTLQFATYWRNDITRQFIATTQTDLQRAGRTVTLADVTTPAAAAPPGLRMVWPLSTLLASVRPSASFLEPGQVSSELFTVDDTGHVRGAVINGPTNVKVTNSPCGWQVGEDPVDIPLQESAAAWKWVARVGYIASMDAETEVTVGKTVTHIPIKAGVNQFYVVGEGDVNKVSFSGLTYGSLCTDDVVVGSVEPLPQTHP